LVRFSFLFCLFIFTVIRRIIMTNTTQSNRITKLGIDQREDCLTEAHSMMIDQIAEMHDIRSDYKVRFSMGDKGRATKVLGHCYPSQASTDGYCQIFISPRIESSHLVLAVLLHETIHSVLDCLHGHRGDFAKIARSMGFIGSHLTKIDTEYLQEEFSDKRWESFNELIELFGDIPHGKLVDKHIKKDTNRSLKVYCPQLTDCGFKFNASATQIKKVIDNQGEISCPNCGESMITPVI